MGYSPAFLSSDLVLAAFLFSKEPCKANQAANRLPGTETRKCQLGTPRHSTIRKFFDWLKWMNSLWAVLVQSPARPSNPPVLPCTAFTYWCTTRRCAQRNDLVTKWYRLWWRESISGPSQREGDRQLWEGGGQFVHLKSWCEENRARESNAGRGDVWCSGGRSETPAHMVSR